MTLRESKENARKVHIQKVYCYSQSPNPLQLKLKTPLILQTWDVHKGETNSNREADESEGIDRQVTYIYTIEFCVYVRERYISPLVTPQVSPTFLAYLFLGAEH